MIIAAKGTAATNAGLTYQWVAVGPSGGLETSTSTTASSWTARTSSFGTTQINWAASDGTLYYVTAGLTGKLATSPDGINWTQRTSSFGTSGIYAVTYGNGIWVAVGEAGKVATATDPTGTWTQRTTGYSGAVAIGGIAYGNGIWVALNVSGEIRTATDPTGTWTLRTSTLTRGSTVRWCPAQAVFVAGADASIATGAFASSSDGITWTARNSPNTTASDVQFYAISNASVIAASYKAINADYATSTNGQTWTDRTPATAGNIYGQGAVDDAGLLVFPRAGTQIDTSSDGTTWTARTGPSFAALGMCHSSGG